MIRRVKRVMGKIKIGHSGTLDPLASGLLIILLGKATKKQSEFMSMDKLYRCRIKLGIKTDTADITGQVIEEKDIPALSLDRIKETATEFLGEQEQIPPMYSALKKEGTPLYKLARKGEVVERKPRKILIHSFEIESFQSPTVDIAVRCSSGTYVRTLAEDLAARLGTVGTMESLSREAIGPFDIGRALSGDDIPLKSQEELWRAAV